MKPTCQSFSTAAREALANEGLQRALRKTAVGFPARRREAMDKLPEFDQLRDAARDIRAHSIENLDFYLERFEARVVEQGGQVHWASTAQDARDAIRRICQRVGARLVTKGKSMASEEVALNDFLESLDLEPVETDLGEYIIQLRHETPSHIIAPAIHLSKDDVAETFRSHHTGFAADRDLETPDALLAEARSVLRQRFLSAEVGITGANLLVAETGSVVLVTNEGNGDLTQTLPRVHIVLVGIEKVVPSLEDASTVLRVLARSITGQDQSVYTTFTTGPRRRGDPDGPEEFHVVLLDNGRSRLLGSEFRDILHCIRCGACLGHCPVYTAVGGHAYGWVYSGPMGAVLTPGLLGIERAHALADASTLCGRCEAICPVRIPLPALLRRWRERAHERRLTSLRRRVAYRLWGFFVRRPRLYALASGAAVRVMRLLGHSRGSVRPLPLTGGWTGTRDLPVPEQRRTFRELYVQQQRLGP